MITVPKHMARHVGTYRRCDFIAQDSNFYDSGSTASFIRHSKSYNNSKT